ncbi:MAG: glycosyltransferase family 4 protein [Acidobacteriia bacterium]|nr:glycosyltransferase family 4 protein [Terriglobia bacterium]
MALLQITIDAVPLLVRSAGVKNYLYYWTGHLRQESRGAEIRLFPFLGEPRELDHEGSMVDPWSTRARLALIYLLNRFPNDISGWMDSDVNVFHSCKLLNPPRHARLTATIHDLTCWLLPETHSPANVAADKRFAERILQRADALIAVSEATRLDAVRILKLVPEKIRVIHHGVADLFFRVTPEDAAAVRSRYGLDRPYLLFVGTIEPRKNIDLLLQAYGGLGASLRDEFDLILAGPPGWAQDETMARLRQPSSPGIRYLGYVAEGDLPGLFAGATAFVYPSLYEGFGFPVAQAMAAGTPVITSAVSALPEIAGGAALLIDPRSEEALRGAIERILTSPSERARLIGLGRENARRFSWVECARQSLRFFEDVA